MTITDKDLLSMQEARNLAMSAYEAQKIWGKATQEQVDRVCAAMADTAFAASERLGRMAAEETGFGVAEHKKLKNEFASKHVWESIKDIKTVGVINHDTARSIYEIAWPVGVVAGLVPSTNPTSTAIDKILISVKARNGIVLTPHPFAVKCTLEAVKIMQDAAERAGAPAGLIGAMSKISLQGTQELMGHKRIALILATGGGPMVRVAHSMGKPAYGVGPGNVPAYVDRSADLEKAAKYIVASKAFDFSTICATEQAVVADRPIAARLAQLMEAEGAYFVNEGQADALRGILFHPNGGINAAATAKSAQYLAAMAGFEIPNDIRILVARVNKVGRDEPLSREKLSPVLAWYDVDGWEDGCECSLELISFGGRGHSLMIHAKDEDVIMAFGLEKPVFRIGVNTMGTLGAIGMTTSVMPSLTLGSGGIGGAITGDNVTVHHLYNVKRIAYETSAPPKAALHPGASSTGDASSDPQMLAKLVEEIVREVLKTQ
ncbi:MAG: aldehyde dehydrogenase family protein [Anaerolineae bacterium]|jgi:acetaldehyde dehydrogenase (acetylating)|nr:aldehyde dehydrogenase family protein [Anaerolineae bacterium]MBT4310813.1 aldehyde dehydrogenase family protein [Anaerolineae bacterium]MBT4456845.1 aldehyde dehydrogenase family protein [Anaerolineae bacterium]MBT6323381.1 aldehyde dehydrogenase family protein [Anaerolineae bacterium]MBT6814666.1 aldehyde dehydrogenase family protein [Anaerolineae bacterium]